MTFLDQFTDHSFSIGHCARARVSSLGALVWYSWHIGTLHFRLACLLPQLETTRTGRPNAPACGSSTVHPGTPSEGAVLCCPCGVDQHPKPCQSHAPCHKMRAAPRNGQHLPRLCHRVVHSLRACLRSREPCAGPAWALRAVRLSCRHPYPGSRGT